MASFKANGKKMEQLPSDFWECERSLNQSAEKLNEVVNALSTLSGMYYVTDVLQKRRENIQTYARGINGLGDGMQQIAQLYVSAENRILENAGAIPHTLPSPGGSGGGREGGGTKKAGEDWLDFIPEGIESLQDLYDWLDGIYDGLTAAQKAALLMALNVLMPGSSLLVLGMMDDGFWGDTLRQVVLGDFTEEEEKTWLGTVLNIAIGYGVYFIPYVGPLIGLALDARDLAASGYKVSKEGWTTENTPDLILNGIAAIPGGDAIKALKGLTATADAASPIVKNADTILDILKKVDSSKVTKAMRNMEEFNPLAKIGQKLVNKVMDIKGLEKMKEGVKTLMDKDLFDPGIFTENTGKWGEVIETAYQEGIDEFIVDGVKDKLSEWKADIQKKVQGQKYGFA